MNHLCTCGHRPAHHDPDTGQCTRMRNYYAGDFGDFGWIAPCLCDRYEWAGDD